MAQATLLKSSVLQKTENCQVQITTVDYLQLKKVQPMHFVAPIEIRLKKLLLLHLPKTHCAQHKLYDLDRILKGKDLEDAAVREEIHASILKNVCGH